MTFKKLSMKGEEFMSRIMRGEREFDRIILKNFDFNSDEQMWNEFQRYLVGQEFDQDKNRIKIDYAEFENVHASGIYVPFIQAHSATLRNVALTYTTIMNADFWYAKLTNVNFIGAEKKGARFNDATLKDVKGLDDIIERCGALRVERTNELYDHVSFYEKALSTIRMYFS